MKDFDEITDRLKIAKKKINNPWKKNDNRGSSYIGTAFKISTELVSAVVIGTIIGFILDSWFDTKPVLIIVFFIIGVVAGIVNVIRSAKLMQKKSIEKDIK